MNSIIKWSLATTSLVAVGVLIGYAVIGFTGGTSSTATTREFVSTAEERIRSAPLIVRAEYIDSTIHSRPILSPVDNEVHGTLTEKFDQYRVLEVINGDYDKADPLFVNDTVNIARERSNGSVENTDVGQVASKKGTEYVLFLRSRARIESDPDQFGPLRWNVASPPGIATLDGDRLKFILPPDVKESLNVSGMALPESDSDAHFSLTLSEIRSSVRTAK